MSTRVGSVTKPDGHVLLDVYASSGGVEVTWHEQGARMVAIDPAQAEAAGALLRVAARVVRRIRRDLVERTAKALRKPEATP